MNRGWLTVWGLVCVLALTMSIAGLAGNPSLDPRWQSVAKAYGLQITDVVPAGVIPLEIQSPEELEQLLRELDREARRTSVPRSGMRLLGNTDVVVPDALTASLEALYTVSIFSVKYDVLVDYVWRTRLNLECSVYVGSYGSFHWIDDVRNLRVYLSGLHPFSTLEDKWTNSYIYPDQQRAIIEGGGILEYFFILDGIFTYYSRSEGICQIYRL